MPLRLFWGACKALERVRADQLLHDLNVQIVTAACANGDKEALPNFRKELLQIKGMITKNRELKSTKDEILALMKG